MTLIGELAVNVAARVGDMKRGLQAGRQDLSGFVSFAARVGPIVGGMAIAAAKGLDRLAEHEGQLIDKLAKASDKLGIQTGDLVGLQYAAEVTAGVVDSTLNMALQRMRRRIAEAAGGSGEAVGALRELGLSAQQLNSLTADQQFLSLADAMQRVQDQGDKIRLTFKLFDSEGVDLVNTLTQGRDAIAALSDEGDRLKGFTREQAAEVEKLNDRQTKLNATWEGMRRDVGLAAGPLRSFSLQLKEEFARGVSASLGELGLLEKATRGEADAMETAAEAGRRLFETKKALRRERQREAALARGAAVRREVALSDRLNAPFVSRLKGVKDQIATAGIDNPLERELALLRGEHDHHITRDSRNELAKNLEKLIELEKKHEQQITHKQRAEEKARRAEELRTTALSSFKDQLKEIESLRSSGLLSTAEAAAATEGLLSGVGSSSKPDQSRNALLQIDSAEAFRAIRQQPQGDPIQKKQLEEQRRMKELAQEQLAALKTIADFRPF